MLHKIMFGATLHKFSLFLAKNYAPEPPECIPDDLIEK